MARTREIDELTICEAWTAVAQDGYRQQLSTIDAVVAQRLGVSVSTVRNFRKREEHGMLGYIFQQRALQFAYRGWVKSDYRRLNDVPEEVLGTFASAVRAGVAPSAVYADMVATASGAGLRLPSLRTFLRRTKGLVG